MSKPQRLDKRLVNRLLLRLRRGRTLESVCAEIGVDFKEVREWIVSEDKWIKNKSELREYLESK